MNSPYKSKFRVSQIFKGSAHDGLDLVGVDSKEIHSTVNGVVERAGWENAANKKQGFGQYVRIKQDGSEDRYYFGHLSSVKVSVGQTVRIGDVIGIEGSTGKSTGSHCHYCIRGNCSTSQIRDVCAISGIPNKVGTYTPVTEGWFEDDNGWYYQEADGSRTKNCWRKDTVGWCYLDADGYMITNAWQRDTVGWCCLGADGRTITSEWLNDNGRWYYFDTEGHAVKGVHTIKDKLFYFAEQDGKGLKECQLIITNSNGEIEVKE